METLYSVDLLVKALEQNPWTHTIFKLRYSRILYRPK